MQQLSYQLQSHLTFTYPVGPSSVFSVLWLLIIQNGEPVQLHLSLQSVYFDDTKYDGVLKQKCCTYRFVSVFGYCHPIAM